MLFAAYDAIFFQRQPFRGFIFKVSPSCEGKQKVNKLPQTFCAARLKRLHLFSIRIPHATVVPRIATVR